MKKKFTIASGQWRNAEDMPDFKKHQNDTAWLCNETGANSGFYLAAKKANNDGKKVLGVHPTSDLINYSFFTEWDTYDDFPVSGMWECPNTCKKYILSVDNQRIWGITDDGSRYLLYESNQNSSKQHRVSMFNVPAK